MDKAAASSAAGMCPIAELMPYASHHDQSQACTANCRDSSSLFSLPISWETNDCTLTSCRLHGCSIFLLDSLKRTHVQLKLLASMIPQSWSSKLDQWPYAKPCFSNHNECAVATPWIPSLKLLETRGSSGSGNN